MVELVEEADLLTEEVDSLDFKGVDNEDFNHLAENLIINSK